MLLTYWRVHLLFTIPPTIILHLLYRPLLTRRNILTLIFFPTVATIWTFPWDDYIIYHKAWTYAPWAVLFTISRVPVEEVFFFIIQSIFTSYAYFILSINVLPHIHLHPPTKPSIVSSAVRTIPALVLATAAIVGWNIAVPDTHTFYLGCILFWALPIHILLSLLSNDYQSRLLPLLLRSILIPTLYLCMVDIVALRAGTWHITERTSTGWFVWKDLPFEEAFFFLVTNMMLVTGHVTFEKAWAVADMWPEVVGGARMEAEAGERRIEAVNREDSKGVAGEAPRILISSSPGFSPAYLAHLLRALTYPHIRLGSRISAPSPAQCTFTDPVLDVLPSLRTTLEILKQHSRSFYTASFVFPKAVRKDLLILYAFCRVTDNMIDNAPDKEEAQRRLATIRIFLDLIYSKPSHPASDVSKFLQSELLPDTRPAFLLLWTIVNRIPRYPFDDLLQGYTRDSSPRPRPITSQEDLIQYSRYVAGSVAEMCVWAMWANEGYGKANARGERYDEKERAKILQAANDMGVVLQLVNVGRDIREDAQMGRVYLPNSWLEEGSKATSKNHRDVLLQSSSSDLDTFPYALYIDRLLALAADYRLGALDAIEQLPSSCRGGVRAAVEVYVQIGKELENRTKGGDANRYDGKRVVVSKVVRMGIIYRELYGWGKWLRWMRVRGRSSSVFER